MEILTVAIELVLLGFILADPVLGVRSYRRLRAVSPSDRGARARFYYKLLLMEWSWAALVIAYAATLPAPLAALGLVIPDVAGGGAILLGALIGIVAGGVISLGTARRRGSSRKALQAIDPMLPKSPRERWLFAAVSVTAGICEELLWRGFLFAALERYVPGINPALKIAASALLFGAAHAYQGVKGILTTGLIGLLLAYLYFATGSLLLPILVHALLDLRVLLFVRQEQEDVALSS